MNSPAPRSWYDQQRERRISERYDQLGIESSKREDYWRKISYASDGLCGPRFVGAETMREFGDVRTLLPSLDSYLFLMEHLVMGFNPSLDTNPAGNLEGWFGDGTHYFSTDLESTHYMREQWLKHGLVKLLCAFNGTASGGNSIKWPSRRANSNCA